MNKQLDIEGLNDVLGCITDDISGVSKEAPKPISTENFKLTTHNEGKIDVNAEHLYKELSALIDIGKNALSSANYILESTGDAESISGIAQMISGIRSVIAEFNKINLLNVKFLQQKELEEIKQQNKLKIIEARNLNTTEEDANNNYKFNTESIIDAILERN